MKICSKCNVEQDEKEYYTYYHSPHKKFYTRLICFTCIKKQGKDYRLKLKEQKQLLEQVPQQEKIIEPQVPESQQEVLEGQLRCTICNEIKGIKEYYPKRKQCIICVRKQENIYRREESLKIKIDNGGSERVPQTPGVYSDEYQEAQTKEFLTALGWIYDEDTKIWNKPGFKENGLFIIIKPKENKRKPGSGGVRKKRKSAVHNNVNEILKLLESGHSYNDVAEFYDCSITLIRKVVNIYRNEKTTS